MQTSANTVYILCPHRVQLMHDSRIQRQVPLSARLEIHVDSVFRNTRRHQLSVAAHDIAAIGFHTDAVNLHLRGHYIPVVFLGRHDIGGLAYYQQPQ